MSLNNLVEQIHEFKLPGNITSPDGEGAFRNTKKMFIHIS